MVSARVILAAIIFNFGPIGQLIARLMLGSNWSYPWLWVLSIPPFTLVGSVMILTGKLKDNAPGAEFSDSLKFGWITGVGTLIGLLAAKFAIDKGWGMLGVLSIVALVDMFVVFGLGTGINVLVQERACGSGKTDVAAAAEFAALTSLIAIAPIIIVAIAKGVLSGASSIAEYAPPEIDMDQPELMALPVLQQSTNNPMHLVLIATFFSVIGTAIAGIAMSFIAAVKACEQR